MDEKDYIILEFLSKSDGWVNIFESKVPPEVIMHFKPHSRDHPDYWRQRLQDLSNKRLISNSRGNEAIILEDGKRVLKEYRKKNIETVLIRFLEHLYKNPDQYFWPEDVLKSLGIPDDDGEIAIAIERKVERDNLARISSDGMMNNTEGEYYLDKMKYGWRDKDEKTTFTQNTGTIIQGSNFSNINHSPFLNAETNRDAHITTSMTDTNSTNARSNKDIHKKLNWLQILSWIIGIIAGLVAIYKFITMLN